MKASVEALGTDPLRATADLAPLRNVLGQANAELFHSGIERRSFDTQQSRGSVWPSQDSVGAMKRFANMIPLGIRKSNWFPSLGFRG